jgi:hypothetical protein
MCDQVLFCHGPVLQRPAMRTSTAIAGTVKQTDAPAWAPLEAAISSELAEWFMWMHEIQLIDGSQLHAYKHLITRRYLHLAEDGRAFDYRVDGLYGEVALASAIVRTFSGWERALPPPRHLEALRLAVKATRNNGGAVRAAQTVPRRLGKDPQNPAAPPVA